MSLWKSTPPPAATRDPLDMLADFGADVGALADEIAALLTSMRSGEPPPTPSTSHPPMAWIVLNPRTHTGSVYPSEERRAAIEHADTLNGLLMACPVVADFREPPPEQEETPTQ